MMKIAKKKQEKEDEIRLALELEERKQVTQSKTMWGFGIFLIAILGVMYLLIVNAIPQKSTPWYPYQINMSPVYNIIYPIPD